MVISSRLSDAELIKRIHLSAAEYSKLIGKSYLIIGKNTKTPYFWFECYFEKKHFMHLLGIRSKTLNADDFYDKCNDFNDGLGEGISIKDCTPAYNHNRTTINEKCSCSKEMFTISDAKYMKVGLKNKISQYVDFTYAYGSSATLGFKHDDTSSFPITLIPSGIDEFSSEKHKIIFVLEKKTEKSLYSKISVEIKKNLFETCYTGFPTELKARIEYEGKECEKE